MRIAIVGAGAMGSVYAGLLASAGNDVMVIHRNRQHVEAIGANGLRVEGVSGDRTVPVRAYTAAPAEPVDLVIIAVKAAQAAVAAQAALPLCGPQTVVLTIQNGLGSADGVARAVGAERLLVGIAGGFGAEIRGPGHAYHNGMNVVRIGPYADLAFEAAEQIAAVWSAAGFRTEAVRDIARMQWEKLICNVAYSAPCALTGMTVGQVMDDPDIGPISRAAATEAWEVGLARGIAITVSDPVAHVRAFAGGMPASKPSMLQDNEARRPSEIDFINGAIPREAAAIGRDAPVNAMLTGLVRAKERLFPA